jgi:hypothetical protein
MIRSIFLSALLTFVLGSQAVAQQRIGVDVTSRMQNLQLTVHYQSVIKNRLLYSCGVFFGGTGKSLVFNDTLQLYGGRSIQSPFSQANASITDTSTSYSILDYSSKARLFGIQAGLGFYYELNVKHGLRFNLNGKIGIATSTVGGYYRSIENFKTVYKKSDHNHLFGAVSAEVFHTIRMSGRWTFSYGVKVPYYFSVDRARFNPIYQQDQLYGFEPELSIGFTRVIGKCD